MASLNAAQLAPIIQAEYFEIRHSEELIIHLLTDSRKFSQAYGCLFFAIPGKHQQGIRFIAELYEKGVRNFIVPQAERKALAEFEEANFWFVLEVIEALQLLATWKRKHFTKEVIGITGSNGKTIVKEWFAQMINSERAICKNPFSYNSQIGVPLSVWALDESSDELAIFEAGISKPNEMQQLQQVIQPTIGLLTNIGAAHDEGFNNRTEKLLEKLKLFTQVKTLIFQKDNEQNSFIESSIIAWKPKQVNLKPWKLISRKTTNEHSEVSISFGGETHRLHIPFYSDINVENAIHAYCLLVESGISSTTALEKLLRLKPQKMRLEFKQGIEGAYIIDDSYSLDISSLEKALLFMKTKRKPNLNKSIAILSDIKESGINSVELYKEVNQLLVREGIHQVLLIGDFKLIDLEQFSIAHKHFSTVAEFVNWEALEVSIAHSLVLIKGARQYAFEKIVNRLSQQLHGTRLEINLDALINNYNFFRNKLAPHTKTMVMVKAFAYGAGAYEVASLLEFHRADYLAVAYTQEGVDLRNEGIRLPIMVMNTNPENYNQLKAFHLEPVVYNLQQLYRLIDFLKENDYALKIHLEFNTGMNRLGFNDSDVEILIQELNVHTSILKIASIFTHLAAADEEALQDFSITQIEKFKALVDRLRKAVPSANAALMHCLNSSGILRFPQAHFDMVRLGIGLYGYESSNAFEQSLKPIGSLKTVISQINEVAEGESVGYGRKGKAFKQTKVATIAIGYADGFRRMLSNGIGTVVIQGKKAKVIGNVCMDMTMIDVSHLENVRVGEEVIIFGEGQSIQEFAEIMQTIPYEVLTSVNERVKRIFYYE